MTALLKEQIKEYRSRGWEVRQNKYFAYELCIKDWIGVMCFANRTSAWKYLIKVREPRSKRDMERAKRKINKETLRERHELKYGGML